MLNELKKQLSGTTGNLCGLAKEVVELVSGGVSGGVSEEVLSSISSLVSQALSWYGEGGVARPGTPKWQAGVPIYKELMDMKVELESQVEPGVLPESVIVNVEELSNGANSPPSTTPLGTTTTPQGTTTTPQGTTTTPQNELVGGGVSECVSGGVSGGVSGKERRTGMSKVSSLKSEVLRDRISKLNGDELLVEVSSLRGKLRDAIVDLIGAAGIRRKGTKWARIKDVEVDRLCRNFLYYWESGSNNKRTYGRLFGEADAMAKRLSAISHQRSAASIVGGALKPYSHKVGGLLVSAISTLHEGTIALTEKAMIQSQIDGARLIEAAAKGHREAQKTHYSGVVRRAKDKRFLKLEAQYLEVKLNQQLAKEAAKDLLSE